MIFMKKLILLLTTGVVLSACAPEPDTLKLLDELVVSTNFDTEADFSEYLTYATPTDTIGYLNNDPNDTLLVYSNSFPYPRQVIQAVRAGMESMGYTRVAPDANPDVGMNIYVVQNLDLYQQVYYPPYYGGYYGYYGYYNYPYVQTYVSNTATLIVEMVDLKNPSGNKVKVVWSAYMGDIISALDYEEQSIDAIDQAFVQSPYLNINNGL